YKLIIEDLQKASKDLPASPKSNEIQAGRASAVAAKHLLAKVYLTRAYGKDAATDDFQHAFTVSKELINELRLMGCHYLLILQMSLTDQRTKHRGSIHCPVFARFGFWRITYLESPLRE
ncbi:MAG: hypothetical protein ACN6PI_22880, partial [Sphingobacterium siyangense]